MKKIKLNIEIVIMLLSIIFLVYIILDYNFYIVKTGSMRPELEVNEFIVVKKNNSRENYKIGDIITFNDSSNITVTHRIVNIRDNGEIFTKGDNNNVEDKEQINKEQIIGKVIFHSLLVGLIIVNYKWQIIILFCIFMIFSNLGRRTKSES